MEPLSFRLIPHGSDSFLEMVKLRAEVLRKPLGLSFDPAELEEEKKELLLGAYQANRLVACCVLTRYNDTAIRLRQMAVDSSRQRSGMGSALLQFAESVARERGYRALCMHARVSAAGFYEKLGYGVQGAVFEEVTIPHVFMTKDLEPAPTALRP